MPSVLGLPSVTEILEAVGLRSSYGFLPPGQRVKALTRGRAVHLAAKYHGDGTLDQDSIHPVVSPFYQGYIRFCEETGHAAIHSELELTHPWGFCGHLDRYGFLMGKRTIIDYKSGSAPDPDEVSLQLAGYRLLWDASHPDEPAEQCVALILSKTGGYRIIEREKGGEPLAGPTAVQTFTAALMVYLARAKMGKL